MMVRHSHFGVGRVLELSGNGASTRITVDFDNHGRKKLVEGRPLSGESVVLIEDTISLGGSSASAVEGLVSEGGKVVGVLAIFTYAFPTAVRRLDALGVPVHTLTSYEALVDTLNLDAPTRDLLLKWRQDFD